jgi:hypothetical protein
MNLIVIRGTMTLSILTLTTMALIIKTFSKMTLRLTTVSITTKKYSDSQHHRKKWHCV